MLNNDSPKGQTGVQNDGQTTATSQPATPKGSARTSKSAAATGGGATIDVGCKNMIGRQLLAVRTELQLNGFSVKVVQTTANGHNNEVVDVTPCQAHRGDEITVTVISSQGSNQTSSSSALPSCTSGSLGSSSACPSKQP